MELSKLNIYNVRNLSSVELETGGGFNVFYGENGAGKTSILEAIHILSHGRSFRGSRIHPLIQHEKELLRVTGKTNTLGKSRQLGVERTRRGLRARIDGCSINSILQLTQSLPILALHPGTFNFLSAEPGQRRAYMDWGVFYEDSGFTQKWRQYKKSLKQRNAALKQGLAERDITVWNDPMADAGSYIDKVRRRYLLELGGVLPELASRFGQDHSIELELKSGWQEGKELGVILEQTLERDRLTGFTHVGPHRADLLVRFNSYEASGFASRGQQKLIAVLLKLAQGTLFVRTNKTPCVLLMDDLPAELDEKRFKQVLKIVADLGLQSFISSIAPLKELPETGKTNKLFHVKHGATKEMI